jgi:hypothetical protein
MFVLTINEKCTLYNSCIEVRIVTGCLEFNDCGFKYGVKIKQN